jgi:ParB-like chromosome segregation protein Spo0J
MVTENTSKASQKYEVHPAANLFPMMSEAEYQGLKADIDEHGQREDIVVWCNKLIDGRNRLRACEELGRNPSIAELDEHHDPVAYVISHNLHRRHLTTSQRAIVAAKMANLKNGQAGNGRKVDPQNCGSTSTEDAAKLLNVSERSIESAKQVIKSADAKVIAAVEQGAMTVNKAVTLVLKKPAKKPKPTKDSSAPLAKKPDEPPLSETWQLAQMAIDKLELIDISDRDRRAALCKVSMWINTQLNAEGGSK